MRKLLAIMLSLAMLLSIGAAMAETVGVATQHMGNAWNKNAVQAIKDVLEPKGFTINHQDGGGITANQVAAVENFITQKVDYIIVSGGEGGAFNEVSLKAKEAGIPVIAIDMFLDGGITGIMCDNWSGGVQMGIYAVNKMGGEGKYIISADTGDDVISAMLEDEAGDWGFMGQNSYELGTLAANSVLTHKAGGTVPFAQIGTTYFVSNDGYVEGDIKTVKFQTPQDHWTEVLEPVLGPLQDFIN